MRTTSVTNYALRLNLNQVGANTAGQSLDKTISRSAAALAAFGLALSSFSLKQMLNTRPRRC